MQNPQTEVQLVMVQIRVAEEGRHEDRARRISKTFSRKFSFPSRTEEIQEELPCSLWGIQVSFKVALSHERLLKYDFSIPGDYAWGREGLDTIVTQLLNQMDNAGKKNSL